LETGNQAIRFCFCLCCWDGCRNIEVDTWAHYLLELLDESLGCGIACREAVDQVANALMQLTIGLAHAFGLEESVCHCFR